MKITPILEGITDNAHDTGYLWIENITEWDKAHYDMRDYEMMLKGYAEASNLKPVDNVFETPQGHLQVTVIKDI